jgi:Skp family chaperone for outer membrane proteins
MKKITMMMMALFLIGSFAMAQQGQRRGFMNPEQMTEQMVKQYSLNDTQKGKLLELNTAFTKEMQKLRPQSQPGERPQWTEEQRTKMREARESYTKKLKGILTEEQFAAYTKDQQNRR